MKTKRTIGCFRAIYWLLFMFCWAFLFWRCRYGFADADEAFYLTIPYRMCRGDHLFLHEWHLSQTSSMLLYPVMWVYLKLFQVTTGMVLHFRWFFTVVWGLAAFYIERRLRLFTESGAKISALVFLLFTSNGIMALNYNTIGIMLLLLCCVTSLAPGAHYKVWYFCSGLMLAGAVLCCPYLVILYLFFTLTAWAAFFEKRKNLLICWLFISIGAAIVFALFCIYLFSNAGLSEYIQVFPLLLKDPEHESITLIKKIRLLLSGAYLSSSLFLPGVCMALIATIVSFFSKQSRAGFFLVCIVSGALLISYYYAEKAVMNYLMFPLSLLGIYCVSADNDPISRRVFFGLWIPGLLYGFCINLSSNQYFFAFSSVSTLMSIASIIIASRYLKKTWTEQGGRSWKTRELYFAFWVLMALQISCELSFRYEKVYWDGGGIHNQVVLAETGPDAGIFMSRIKHAQYEQSMTDIESICSRPDVQKILFLSLDSGLYLIAQKDFATYSAWLYDVDALEEYYTVFPDKRPDAIYASGDYYLQFIPMFLENGYYIDKTDENAETAILYPG